MVGLAARFATYRGLCCSTCCAVLQETIEKTDASGKLLPEMVRRWAAWATPWAGHSHSGGVWTAGPAAPSQLQSAVSLGPSQPHHASPFPPLTPAADPDLPEPAQQPAAPQRVHPRRHAALPVPDTRGGAAGAAGALGWVDQGALCVHAGGMEREWVLTLAVEPACAATRLRHQAQIYHCRCGDLCNVATCAPHTCGVLTPSLLPQSLPTWSTVTRMCARTQCWR